MQYKWIPVNTSSYNVVPLDTSKIQHLACAVTMATSRCQWLPKVPLDSSKIQDLGCTVPVVTMSYHGDLVVTYSISCYQKIPINTRHYITLLMVTSEQ